MLTDIKNLKSYLISIPKENMKNTIQEGSLSSIFFMQIINTFLQDFTYFQDIALSYLLILVSSNQIQAINKALAPEERLNIQELLRLLESPSGFEIFI